MLQHVLNDNIFRCSWWRTQVIIILNSMTTKSTKMMVIMVMMSDDNVLCANYTHPKSKVSLPLLLWGLSIPTAPPSHEARQQLDAEQSQRLLGAWGGIWPTSTHNFMMIALVLNDIGCTRQILWLSLIPPMSTLALGPQMRGLMTKHHCRQWGAVNWPYRRASLIIMHDCNCTKG